ncbi:MAG: choice-of-anchor D domain-containing protein, partial [Candidatus Acidiferrales bacterium]
FEANEGQAPSEVAFLARGPHLSTFLTRTGIEVEPREPRASRSNLATHRRIQISFAPAPRSSDGQASDRTNASVTWKGIAQLRAQTNYFIGNDPSKWRTSVPHYAQAEAPRILPGVDLVAYSNATADQRENQLEFDLRIAPQANADSLRIKISGAEELRLNAEGDMLMQVENAQLVLHKPALYEEVRSRELAHKSAAATSPPQRYPIEGAYLFEPDGSIGFRIARRHPHAALVIDPSLSITYSTFLGGAGEDTANSIAADSTGKLYIAGTTTSASTFPESTPATTGPGGGATDFFIAKIDPTASGANSLIYLTFLGGSGNEKGGMIAVDSSGRVAITGTTTSTDFPVTDGSVRTSGANDIAVTELAPTGTSLVYSTLFGGSGSESTQNPGGIALDQAGEIFIASDTTSTNLPVTSGAFQAANGGGTSDGFLAIFRPLATAPTPHLKYCTYLGINAQVGIGGVAVDAASNAYITGFTSNPGATFPTLNGYQTTYAGDPLDAFVIKIRPSGTAASDLAYGTFLGGAGLDQALAISVGAAMPATAYVTGTTQSTNFPTNGTNAGAQSTLKGTAKGSANAFFSAIAQNATTGMTSLLYSTYLGGTQSDSGLSVAALAPNALYISGKTTSWDFPWFNNLQPFTGNEDAFVAKFDPTASGRASLIYATPLAGTAPPGSTAVTDGNAIAADALGDVYVAGRSTSSDFPSGVNLSTGLQTICASCQELPPAADAFVLAFHESANSAPSVSFTTRNINFGAQPVGAQNIPPLFSALINTGDAPLNVSNIALSGPNVSSFSIVGSDPCIGTPMPPRATCSFEISFSPTAVGPAEAFATITDDAPGSPHVLSVVGIGSGALAVLSSTSLSFGNQPQGSISASKAVTLFNLGNQPLVVTNLTLTGVDANQFSLQSNNCDSNSIAGGASCTINVVFAPLGTASYRAEIDIIDNSGGLTGAKQVIALSGTGVAASPIANLSPASLTFGTLAVGTTSGPQPITLRNLGSAALTLSQLTFTGSDAASFAVAPTGTTCPIGSTVAIGANCLVQIVFAPQTSGAKNATVNFIDNASGGPQSISLSGMAIAPTLQISPSSLSFAAQSVGTSSPSQTITLSSTGTSSVTINGITVIGPNAADFSESGNCSAVLGAGASCQLTVIFKPLAAGNRSASISISDNAAGNPHSVTVAGTATQAAVSISPATLNFANQLVGTASPPVPITVTNTGTGALVIASISFPGANAADFTQKNTCTAPVAPAATCLINLTFAPTAVGARTANMTIADNASNAPQSVSLTATAMNFAIDPPNVGATSATITAGQTATYQLNLKSIDGFAGPVTLTCSGAPAGATCTVIPTPITLAANATAPFQVQVSTTARPATTNLLPVQMSLNAQTSPGPQNPSDSSTPPPSFQQPKLVPETNAPQSSLLITPVSTTSLSFIALPKSDSRFWARAKRSVLFALAVRTAGVSPAPLMLPLASNSKIQIRRLLENSSFALIALIAILIAIRIAAERIIALRIHLASLFSPVAHGQLRCLRNEHRNYNFLPTSLPSQRSASNSADRVGIAANRIRCGSDRIGFAANGIGHDRDRIALAIDRVRLAANRAESGMHRIRFAMHHIGFAIRRVKPVVAQPGLLQLSLYKRLHRSLHQSRYPKATTPRRTRPPKLQQARQPQPGNRLRPGHRSNPHRSLLRRPPPHNPNLYHPTRHLHPHPNIHLPLPPPPPHPQPYPSP